jgi:hypothetical protein
MTKIAQLVVSGDQAKHNRAHGRRGAALFRSAAALLALFTLAAPASARPFAGELSKGRAITMRKRFALIAALLAGACLSASVFAAPVVTSGGAVIKVYNKSDTSSFLTTSLAYVLVNHIQVEVTGPSKLITANFTAESTCQSGGAPQYCSIRLVARNKTTLVETPLAPASDDDYAFDSVNQTGEDWYEGHAVERSARLPAGIYYIRVEALVTDASTVFSVDDWHLHVEVAQ